MKKTILLSILLALLGTSYAMPPKPEVLEALLQAGDTARYGQMVRHSALLQERVAERQSRQHRAPSQTQQACPLNIAPRGLVILVNFQDVQFITPYDEIHEMINGENYSRTLGSGLTRITANGSARQYFIDQSWGQYQPQFDVVGPYTISHNYSHYGKNSTQTGSDERAYEMIYEACVLADQNGVDFSLYDNNGDGDVDFVYVIYAGEGEADGGDANTIWPHTYWLKNGYGVTLTLDHRDIDTYACGNELMHGTEIRTGIGTFCHEFSHVLGLPDLYNTQSSHSSKLMGYWDILDAGSYNNAGNTPPSYSAYERFFMGWLTPTQISGDLFVTLHPLNTGRGAALIASSMHNLIGNDPNPTTFYMLELRKKSGWDKYLPGSGMMITKIKYNYWSWQQNTVNNSTWNLGVDIIEADGISTSDYIGGKAKDLFPSGAKEYKDISGYQITNIGWKNMMADIGFTLNVGGESIEIGTVETAIDVIDDNENENENRALKRVEDGRIVIMRGEKKFDIMGKPIK